MMRNIIPALFALVITIILANMLSKKNDDPITAADLEGSDKQQLPGFLPAILGPVVVIALLALRPICGVSIDPLIALPVGGLVSVLVTGNAKNLVAYTEYGLSKVIGVSILLIGTGTIAGIIKASALQSDVTNLLAAMHMPAFILAPLSGILLLSGPAVRRCPGAGCRRHDPRGRHGSGFPASRLLLPRHRRQRRHGYLQAHEAHPL